MTFDLQQIIESKRARRRALAQRPVAEKLAMLEALRDRTRTLRAATFDKGSSKQNATFCRHSQGRHKVGMDGLIYE